MKTRTLYKGFTLVELLLGLLMAAIVGVSVYNMFWSAMKLDDRMRRMHDTYMELLMADEAMTRDLENAVNLDFSASYPNVQVFDGSPEEFSFLTQTGKGIRRVRYYSGLLDNAAARSMIGRVVNTGRRPVDSLPVEFLIRQEGSVADWLKDQTNDTSAQIVAAGLKKGSLRCLYAPVSSDVQKTGAQAVDYQESWDKKQLPLAVRCGFVLYDAQNPDQGLMFQRDIFLAPTVQAQSHE